MENKFKEIFVKRNRFFPVVAYTTEVTGSDKYIEIAAVEQLKAEIQSWMKKVSEQEHTIVDWENYVAREKTENHKLKSKLKIAKETLTNLKSWGYQTQWEIIDKAISKIGGEI